MKRLFKKISNWFSSGIKSITPGRTAVKGAGRGVLSFTAIIWSTATIIWLSRGNDIFSLVLFAGLVGAVVLASYLFIFVINLVAKISGFYKWAIFISMPLLFFATYGYELAALFIIIGSLLGASAAVIRHTRFSNLTPPKRAVTIVGLLIGLAGLVASVILYVPEGFDVEEFENAASKSKAEIKQLDVGDPADPGSFEVKTLTYGSGKDKHRSEFSRDVTILTDSVNGVAFLDDWDGISGWYRTWYWGHDDKALPLNGRVWYPEGTGPFPLVLVVHGNHGMQDYSDPGYDYLGELLASRGIILASIDENFINGSWTDIFGGLDKENDARGWLLLEHLRQWHEWNADPGNQFYGKIDTTRLSLIGHSRGGEAIGHAASFNALPYYPDDASVKFDYNFNIKSVIAIAPVDGQYEPGKTRDKFENVSYFVLHGSQDADVSSFMGSQQYERIKFTDSSYHFKAGLWIYGANHGQFNTSWGNNDIGIPFTRLLNLKQLMAKEDQEQVAKVYISAFLEATLNDNSEYLPLFADARTGKDWLPETVYLNQFEDSNGKFFATYDEDFNVTTITTGSAIISSKNLTIWKEREIEMLWNKKGTRAVYLGWNHEEDDQDKSEDEAEVENELDEHYDTVPDSLIASYTIDFSAGPIEISQFSSLIFSMAESTEDSDPKSSGKWLLEGNEDSEDEKEEPDEEDEDEDEDENEDVEDDEDDEDEIEDAIDFTIQLEDSSGHVASLPLSHFSYLQREINIKHMKTDFIWDENSSENIFQLFIYPLKDFQTANPDFNYSALSRLSFIFNRTESGVVIIDNIGFMKDL